MLQPIFRLIGNIFRILGYLWTSFWYRVNKAFRGDRPLYVKLELDESYLFGPPGGVGQWFRSKPTLIELHETIQRLESESDIDGVILTADGIALGAAQIDELMRQLDSLRESGKHLVAHSRSPQMKDYLLMSSADEMLLSPPGRLYTFGPRFDQYFGSEALGKLGVVPQFIHIGQYKTAAHRFTHREMTAPQEVMMESLYESLIDLQLERIASRRKISTDKAERLFTEPPHAVDSAIRDELLDGGVFRRQIPNWLTDPEQSTALHVEPDDKQDTDDDEKQQKPTPVVVDADQMVGSMPKPRTWKPLFSNRPAIALVDLTGMIVMGETPFPGGNQPTIDPESVGDVLEEIEYNPRYSGAVLHINSPGGSALASDIIWQQIKRLGQRKPVVAYCTDVAASGGYYLASAADDITCHRFTITGSIGVVTGQFSIQDTPEKLGLNVESIYRNESDTFTSPFHRLSDDQVEGLRSDARHFYRRFLRRVGEARQISRRRLHRYGRGRVYTGPQASTRDLVDRVGRLDDALDRVCELGDINREKIVTDFVPHKIASLGDVFRNRVTSPRLEQMAEAIEKPVNLARWLDEEPVLALMPYELTFK